MSGRFSTREEKGCPGFGVTLCFVIEMDLWEI